MYTHSRDIVYLRAKIFPSEKTIGGNLLKLNEHVWFMFSEFSSVLSQILQDVPNPKFEHLKACKAELEKIGWQEPEFLNVLARLDYIPSKRLIRWVNEFIIEDFLIKERHSIYCAERDYSYDYRIITYVSSSYDVINEPFIVFLDEIMPAVCLGVYEIIFGKDESGKDTFVVMRR